MRKNKRSGRPNKKNRNKRRKKAKMKFALMLDNYGPFRKGRSYFVVNEGKDWYLTRNNGSNYYVMKDFVDPDPFAYLHDASKYEKDLGVDEIEFDEDFIFQ